MDTHVLADAHRALGAVRTDHQSQRLVRIELVRVVVGVEPTGQPDDRVRVDQSRCDDVGFEHVDALGHVHARRRPDGRQIWDIDVSELPNGRLNPDGLLLGNDVVYRIVGGALRVSDEG